MATEQLVATEQPLGLAPTFFFGNGDCNCDCNGDCDCNRDCDCHCHCDGHRYCHSHRHSHGDSGFASVEPLDPHADRRG